MEKEINVKGIIFMKNYMRVSLSLFALAVFILACENPAANIIEVPNYIVIISGTPINSAEELAKIGTDENFPLAGEYYFAADIDLSGAEWTPWVPLGSAGAPFTGILHGNGKTISGLTLDGSGTAQYIGLFGYTYTAKIEDLTVKITNRADSALELSFAGIQYIGAFAAYAEQTKLSNITVIGNAAGAGIKSVKSGSGAHYVGGVIGYAKGPHVMKNLHSSIPVLAGTALTVAQYAGGIVGYSSLTVMSGCEVTADSVESTGTGGAFYAGGIAGYAGSSIEDSISNVLSVKAEGSGTGAKYAGGITGYSSGAIVKRIRWTGTTVLGKSTGTAGGSIYAGGIIGLGTSSTQGSVTNPEAEIKAESAGTGDIWVGGIGGSTIAIESSVPVKAKVLAIRTNTGTATNKKTNAGGIIGTGHCENSYAFSDVTIESSYAITATTNYFTSAGGLAGVATGFINKSYATGKVTVINTGATGVVYAGGLAGTVGTIDSNSAAQVLQSFAANEGIYVTTNNTGAVNPNNTTPGAVFANRVAGKAFGVHEPSESILYGDYSNVLYSGVANATVLVYVNSTPIDQTTVGVGPMKVTGSNYTTLNEAAFNNFAWDIDGDDSPWTWDSAKNLPVLKWEKR
jgi:hypothetical protein